MIKYTVYEQQDDTFYTAMGRLFADRRVIKELDGQLYSNENSIWIVATDNGSFAGCVSLERLAKYSLLDNFYVLEAYRSNGVGSELVEKLSNYFSDIEIRLVTRNSVALELFKKYGFNEYGKNGRYSKMKRLK